MNHYELKFKHLLSLTLLKFSSFLKLILASSSWLLILFYITLVIFDNFLTIWNVKLFQDLNMYFQPQTWDQPFLLLKLLQTSCSWIVPISAQFWLLLQHIRVGYVGGLPILYQITLILIISFLQPTWRFRKHRACSGYRFVPIYLSFRFMG